MSLVQELIGEVVPRPYVKKISLSTPQSLGHYQNPTQEETQVDIHIVFKDIVEAGLEQFWLDNSGKNKSDFSWLNAALFVFTDSVKKNHYVGSNSFFFKNPIWEKSFLGNSHKMDGVEAHKLKFAGLTAVNATPTLEQTDNPSTVATEYEINFHVSFILTGPINNLHVAAISAYNMPEELTIPLGITPSEKQDLLRESAEFLYEDIFVDGKLVALANIFQLESGAVWQGAAHYDRIKGQYYTGGSPKPNKQLLIAIQVQNNTIVDNRHVERILDRVIDFTNLENELSKFTMSNHQEPKRKPAIFSKLFLTELEDESSRMYFSINYFEALKHASQWPWLFENPVARTAILNLSKIRKLMLVKKRVSAYDYDFSFEDNGEELVLLDATDQREFPIIDPSNQNGLKIREITDDIFTYDPNAFKLKERSFTAVDETAADDLRGIYRYFLTLDVEDGAHRYLLGKRNDLLHSIAEFEEYAHLAARPENFDYLADKYRNGSWINAFKEITERKIWRKLSSEIVTLVQFLSGKTDIMLFGLDRSQLIKAMAKIAHPRFGSPTGNDRLLAIANLIATKIENLLGSNTKSRVGNLEKTGKKQQFPTRTIRYEHAFNEVLNLDDEPNVGYSYFRNIDLNNGLPVIKESAYRNRVKQETTKYFATPNPLFRLSNFPDYSESLANNAYTYFTPLELKLPNFIVDTSNFVNMRQYKGLLGTIILAKKLDYDLDGISKFEFKFNSLGLQRISNKARRRSVRRKDTPCGTRGKNQSDIERLMQNRSVIIRPKNSGNTNRANNPKRTTNRGTSQLDLASGLVSSNETFTSTGTFTSEVTPKTEDLVAPHSTGVETTEAAENIFDSLFLVNKTKPNTIPQFLANINTQGEDFIYTSGYIGGDPAMAVAALPNQIKAVMAGSSDTPNSNLVSWFNPGVQQKDMLSNYVVNLMNIVRLKMYNGYERGINNPLWKDLLSSDVNAARAAGKRYILCKLEKYQNSDIFPETTAGFKLPILADYFLLEIDFALGAIETLVGTSSEPVTLEEAGFVETTTAAELNEGLPDASAADIEFIGVPGLAATVEQNSQEDDSFVGIKPVAISPIFAALAKTEEQEEIDPNLTETTFQHTAIPTFGDIDG